MKDKEGKVGSPNAPIQIDLFIRNGEYILIEIKFSADYEHVERFYKIGELYKELTGQTPKFIFVAVDMGKKGGKRYQDLDIQLITYDDLETEM